MVTMFERKIKMASFVDFHIHSTASDGKDSPTALWDKIKKAGIRYFALTDHDTVEGVREVERLVANDGAANIRFVRGIEFSCVTPVGKCHILGYDYDINNKAFTDVLHKGANLRQKKLEQRLTFLKEEYGIEFADADVAAMRRMDSVGKPHLGELMVKMGIAATTQEAIKNYIDKCSALDSRVSAQEAIAGILAAEGIPCWAHPYGGVGESRVEGEKFAKQLHYLLDVGLAALECYYSRYTKTEADSLAKCARKNGLYVSGGSDYHGRKNYFPLGTLNADDIPVTAADLSICERFGFSLT